MKGMASKLIPLILAGCALALSACASHDGHAAESSGSVDRAFVAAMTPHHESAVDMALIARDRAESRFVKALAANILRTQTAEIETMRAQDAELAADGEEVGDLGVPDHMMGMDMDAESLRTADPFDSAFLNLMIPHHEGAVVMAQVELDKGSDPELKALAEQIISAQEGEIAQMKSALGDDATGAGAAHHSG